MSGLRHYHLPLVGVRALVAVSLAVCIAAAAAPAQTEGGVVELDTSPLGQPLGEPLQGEALDQATDEIASVMRCPVCQGMAIADSPATMAVAMRDQVREMLALGYSPEQVWSYFEGSYGEFVRLQPKAEGLNWLVWLVPPIAIALAALLVIGFQKRRSASRAQDPASEEPLDRLLQQVREDVARDA